ncbi:unnamed protein product [Mesocestoides corti]|nr:unnamed protein product [Mesocestoides corti]
MFASLKRWKCETPAPLESAKDTSGSGDGSFKLESPASPAFPEVTSLRLAEAVIRIGDHVTAAVLGGRNQDRAAKPASTRASPKRIAPLPLSDDPLTPISNVVALRRARPADDSSPSNYH